VITTSRASYALQAGPATGIVLAWAGSRAVETGLDEMEEYHAGFEPGRAEAAEPGSEKAAGLFEKQRSGQ